MLAQNNWSSNLKYCSKHGKNPTHTSEQCWQLHPNLMPENLKAKRAKWQEKKAAAPNSKNAKEVNAMNVDAGSATSKAELKVANDKIAKLTEQYAELMKKLGDKGNDSDDMSVDVTEKKEPPIPRKKGLKGKEKKKKAEKATINIDEIEEERKFRKRLMRDAAATDGETSDGGSSGQTAEY